MRSALAIVLCTVAACGGGGGGTTGPGTTGNTQGTFSAVIDGQNWISTTNQTTGSSGSNAVPGTVSIIGTQLLSVTSYTSLTLALGYIAGPGTYPLGVNQGTTAGGTGLVIAPQPGTSIGDWSTGFSGAAGSVTVTSLTSARIAGTFHFNAPPAAFTATTGTRIVTNGIFDMPLPSGFTTAPASDNGSKVSALVGGTAWNAATVVALGGSGTFGFTGTTDSLAVTFAPSVAMSAGHSYQIGGSGGATMIAVRTGTSDSWSSGAAGAAGTLTVTSFNGLRAAGTFSASLLPGGSASGALVMTNGSFDVRVDVP